MKSRGGFYNKVGIEEEVSILSGLGHELPCIDAQKFV
jgi:hypothetical protein